MLNFIISIYFPTEIIGYSLVYGKASNDITLKLLNELLNKPNFFIKELEFDYVSEFNYFRNILLQDFNLTEGSLIYEFDFKNPSLVVNKTKITFSLGGYFHNITLNNNSFNDTFLLINENVYFLKNGKAINIISGDVYSLKEFFRTFKRTRKFISFKQTWGNKLISLIHKRLLNFRMILKNNINSDEATIFFIFMDKQFDYYVPSLLTHVLSEKLKAYLKKEYGLSFEHVWFLYNRDIKNFVYFINQIPDNIKGLRKLRIPMKDLEYLNSLLENEENNLRQLYEIKLKDINTSIMVILTMIMLLLFPSYLLNLILSII
ncbi:MAG: hypothetical protein ACP6IP_07915 [Candidatus Njordarchaeia archaeon]